MSALQSLSEKGSLGSNPFLPQLPSLYPTRNPIKEILVGVTAPTSPTMWEGQPEPLLWVLAKYHLQDLRPLQCIILCLIMCLLAIGQCRLCHVALSPLTRPV